MKKHLLTIAFLIFFLSLSLSGMTQEARSILIESNTRFATLQDFSADMVYSIQSLISTNVNASKRGEIIYSKGKYVVKMPEQEIYTD